MDTLEFVYEPWKYPDDDYPYPGDWDCEMDIDDGGFGWYESGPGDNKCILDKALPAYWFPWVMWYQRKERRLLFSWSA